MTTPQALRSSGTFVTPSSRQGRLPEARIGKRAFYGIVMVAFVLLWCLFLDQRLLADPDEARYAEIAREMVVTGDWITPHLNGLIYLEKPPLQYWVTAAAFELFGQHNWTARFWVALSGFAGILLAFYLGRRLHSLRSGLCAGLMLASSTLYFGMAHLNTLDMGLTLFLQIAIFGLALGLRSGVAETERRFWMHVAWAGMGLAILSKGLVGLVLPIGTLVVYSVFYRDYALWKKLHPFTGVALLLLITAPWFVAVALRNPDFMQFFFVHEHFTRFLTTEHHRHQPWWFFLPILLLGALPWTGPMLRGAWQSMRAPVGNKEFDPYRFLAVWAAVVLVFFSASGSKLIPYIVPAYPALAVIGGRYVANATGRWARNGALIGIALFAVVAQQLLLLSVDQIAPAKSTAPLVRQLTPYLTVSTRVYSVRTYPPSLSVYLGRTVTLVEYRNELDFGLRREPQKTIATVADFVKAWGVETDAVAIMPHSTYADFLASGVPMQFIAGDAERVAVGTVQSAPGRGGAPVSLQKDDTHMHGPPA